MNFKLSTKELNIPTERESVYVKEMAEFPFSWHLQRTGTMHQKKNRQISNLKINAEWSLVCLWSHHDPYKPEFLEIRRTSLVREILVSGNFKLMCNGNCILQRKFMQVIEAGLATTLIELESGYCSDNYYYNSRNYSIAGSLTISPYGADKEYVKGIQFKSLFNLSGDLECLLDPDSTYFSDVNVNCGTVSFSAHKSILCARSRVFAAMFTTKMKETLNNKLDITDISPEVLKTVLTFIYSGKTGDLTVKSAGELLFAADKYELQDLKRVCCDYLKSCVSNENVLKTLILGDFHDKSLKVFAMDFICNSCEEFEVLEKTTEWTELRLKKPSLAMDVLTSLVNSKDQKLKNLKTR